MAQAACRSYGSLRREVLRNEAAQQPHQRHNEQQRKAREDIMPVIFKNADIDDARDDQRDSEVESRLQHLKQRGKDRLKLVFFQIRKQMPHRFLHSK